MTDKQTRNAMLIMLECISDVYEILDLLRFYVGYNKREETTDTINYRKNVVSELLQAIREDNEED